MLFPQNSNLPNAPRLFARPQSGANPSQSVLYASASRSTKAQLLSAMNRRRGTRNTRPSLEESTEHSMPKPQDNVSVQDGNDVKGAQTGITTPIAVWDVALPLTELTTVLRCRGLQAQTPYNPNAWERALVLADPDHHFCSIPDGLRFGFIIDFPNILSVQSPPNSPSVLTYVSELENIVQKEVDKGRYIGPIPLPTILSALGPYQSSLLSIIPKLGHPRNLDSFRISPSPWILLPNTLSHPLTLILTQRVSPPCGESSPRSTSWLLVSR